MLIALAPAISRMHKGPFQRPPFCSLSKANTDCKEDLQPMPPDSERATELHSIAPFLGFVFDGAMPRGRS